MQRRWGQVVGCFGRDGGDEPPEEVNLERAGAGVSAQRHGKCQSPGEGWRD